jgi:Peptidase M61 N-terminal domain
VRVRAARLALGVAGVTAAVTRPPPTIRYTLRLDAAHPAVAELTIALRDVPASLRLAMKVHAEYDARYWRYVEDMRVAGTGDDARAGVSREDSTVWRVTLPDGHGVVRYRVRIQPPPSGLRRAWLPYARSDGALINSPDFFLYLPEFPSAPATVDLDRGEFRADGGAS